MKKILTTLMAGTFLLAIASCGGGDCDAYHKADYTKYKAEKQQKEVIHTMADAGRK